MTDHDPREHLDQLMEWARNYQSSRVLTTAVEKQLLERFQGGPRTLDEALRPEEDAEAVRRFLNTLCSMGLLRFEGQASGYEPTKLTRQYLLPGGRFDVRPILSLFHRNYELWARLPETLEQGHDVEYEAYGDVEFGREFMLAMETRAHFAKQDVADVVSEYLGEGDRFVDLGGGTGVFARAILEATEGTGAVLTDLEHVVETAREFCEDSPVADRISYRTLDFFEADSYGKGLDAALLFSICHIFGDEKLRTVLERTAGALRPGGYLFIRDYVLNKDGVGPPEGNFFDLHMLLATSAGGNRSLGEYRNLLRAAGFKDVRREELPGDDDLLVARRAE
jgi:hypothetical protein